MSLLIVDSSVALTWCFEDEATTETDRIFEQVRGHGAIVPALWHLELGNVLLQAEKRGRISWADISIRLSLIAALPITTDHDAPRLTREILELARAQQLTAYDATYLELALRKGAAIATKDVALIAAAKRLGVTALP